MGKISHQKVVAATIAFGLALLLFIRLTPMTLDYSALLTTYGVFAFLVVSTFALKVFTTAETYYLFGLLRTRRFMGFIESLSRHDLWDKLADLGIILGFGTIAVDYLFARKMSKGKRIAVNLISFVLLFFFFNLVFGSMVFESNPEMALVLLAFSMAFAFGGLMLFAIAALIFQALDIVSKMLVGKTPCPGVAPIIPGVQLPNVPTFLTPPLYIWIAFVIILVVHEFSHGALIRRAKGKIKSVGLLLAGIFPIGAFVEPDDKEIKGKPERQQLRIYAIGPAANLFVIPLFLAIFLFLQCSAFSDCLPNVVGLEKEIMLESVVVSDVLDDLNLCGETIESSAKGVIQKGWKVKQYNGVELDNFYNFKRALLIPSPTVSLILETESEELLEKNLERKPHIGSGILTELTIQDGTAPSQDYVLLMQALDILRKFFIWLLMLSFAIAVVNFLPIEPFDGGKMAKIILLPYFGFLQMNQQDTEKFIGRLFLWIVVGLLVLNAMPLLL